MKRAQTKFTLELPKIAVATRIQEAVNPKLNSRSLFSLYLEGPHSFWASNGFLVASTVSPLFTSFEVWSFDPVDEPSELVLSQSKMLNLRRLLDGSSELVSFRRGDWERDLLRYVGAPLGLLTIRPC